MKKNNFLLTFELSPERDLLDIHCDAAGLEQLILTLSRLRNKRDHEHLMTPSFGGNELSEDVQSNGSHLLHMVTIHNWND
ncbi:hypothetical protein CH371_11490 [Leptospira wolffii]|uniref:Methylhydantoinase n=1 Tax=Leptospira wolffii TaxID=409998 RepID=A0A2M9ZB31_9LEPT|nr:Imm32 family immunity protein [Leptospira wolffii]PJZ65557.1 hypothetical protein CH371_11490 [Leptospira wolffii]